MDKVEYLKAKVVQMKKDKKIKYKEVAAYATVSSSMITGWLNGSKNLSQANLDKLAERLLVHETLYQMRQEKLAEEARQRKAREITEEIERLEKELSEIRGE